jgi:uncharacterized RmlC-like cupin family protein
MTEAAWRRDGVRVIPGGALPVAAQTARHGAIDLARVEAAKLWAGTVTNHPDARTGPHHHGPLARWLIP